jgi:hypothetical protein
MLSFKKQFLHPNNNLFSSLINTILNNHSLISVKQKLNRPFNNVILKSNITNVVYLNWMLPLEQVKHLIPSGFELQDFENDTVLSILNYKHGNFGPNFLKPIKNILGSPKQSNWRLYLKPKSGTTSTVVFLSNVMSSEIYSIGSRIFSNIMDTHYPKSFTHEKIDKKLIGKIVKGNSNSPELDLQATIGKDWIIPHSFQKISKDNIEIIKWITQQNFAINFLPNNKYCLAEINLDFQINEILPLKIDFLASSTLENYIDFSQCFAFLIPEVKFTNLSEKIIKFNKSL